MILVTGTAIVIMSVIIFFVIFLEGYRGFIITPNAWYPLENEPYIDPERRFQIHLPKGWQEKEVIYGDVINAFVSPRNQDKVIIIDHRHLKPPALYAIRYKEITWYTRRIKINGKTARLIRDNPPWQQLIAGDNLRFSVPGYYAQGRLTLFNLYYNELIKRSLLTFRILE